ncbi:MAG TPA: hypothetical protein PKE21_10545 [Flavobacteriales bacterium]|nr:hypothetical protein [Flavobacteriales bacterium]HMR27906.1 hypothetical protein [Flavobacteriales bacterium]
MLTATDIAWHMRLFAHGLGHQWITPNVTYYAWESDLLTVTREGFVCEVEIKVSRNDLRNDLLKPKHSRGILLNGAFPQKSEGVRPTPSEARELDRHARGEVACGRPNYFCFAMPCDVYRKPQPIALPPYAGVYTVDDEGRVFEEKRPIQLHGARIGADDLLDLARRIHHRYWNELRRAAQGANGQ